MLLAILKKEILLTLRDVHALAVLFVMPMAFILVMSLALQDVDNVGQKKFDVGLVFLDSKDKLHPVAKKIITNSIFKFRLYNDITEVRENARENNLLAAVVIPEKFFSKMNTDVNSTPIQVQFSATTPLPLRKLLVSVLQKEVASYLLEQRIAKDVNDPFLRKALQTKLMGNSLIIESELGNKKNKLLKPSSVQQSVPAWLIFSMFFVVIPIATTFITEKQAGTLQRLMTLPVAHTYLLLGKLIPYLGINLIQTVLMFLVGIYLVPIVGGEGLILSDNAWLLLPMSLAVGVSAISLALLIATIVRTTEQATTLGGVINLLLAAVGGIMVPVYVMPEFMQWAAAVSPMNWGLEGFLTILLRGGEFRDIAPYMGGLLLLAVGFFLLAVVNYRRAINAKV